MSHSPRKIPPPAELGADDRLGRNPRVDPAEFARRARRLPPALARYDARAFGLFTPTPRNDPTERSGPPTPARRRRFSRLPPPPIDEAGWGRVPVAVGTRALGRARGVDARNFEAGRALGTPTRPLTPSVRSPTTPSPGAPSQWRPRRLRTQRGSGQRCPQLCTGPRPVRTSQRMARSAADRQVDPVFPNWGAYGFRMLTHHAGIFSTEERRWTNRPGLVGAKAKRRPKSAKQCREWRSGLRKGSILHNPAFPPRGAAGL